MLLGGWKSRYLDDNPPRNIESWLPYPKTYQKLVPTLKIKIKIRTSYFQCEWHTTVTPQQYNSSYYPYLTDIITD